MCTARVEGPHRRGNTAPSGVSAVCQSSAVLSVNTLGFRDALALLIPFEIAAIGFTCWPTGSRAGCRR